MSNLLKQYGLDQLSSAEKLQLVQELWDSIESDEERILLTEAQKQDLQRRLANYEANHKARSTWEEVKARLREKS